MSQQQGELVNQHLGTNLAHKKDLNSHTHTCTHHPTKGAEDSSSWRSFNENFNFLPENLSVLRFITFSDKNLGCSAVCPCHRLSALQKVLEFSESNYLSQRDD